MMARALVKNGASKVYIAGRRLALLQQASSEIGSNVIPIQCDVTSKDDLKQAAHFIRQDAGYLNLLICNSGISGPQVKPITGETTIEEWASQNFEHDFADYANVFAVNSAAVWYTTMAFLTLLDEGNKKRNAEQSSQVIVIGSIATFNNKAPGGWAYGQSKAAATAAMKQLAVALPQWNIRANCIAPGLFPSEMSGPLLSQYKDETGGYSAVPGDMIPLRRLGDDKDMSTLLYLASRAGAYTNRAVLIDS